MNNTMLKLELAAESCVLDLSRPDEFVVCNDLVDSAPIPDTYFRPAYVVPHEVSGQGKARAFVIRAGSHVFLVPLLLRPLSDVAFTHYMEGYDAITPYGYGGLLKLTHGEVQELDIRQFFESLRTLCIENRVISCLLRLHPLLQQDDWCELRSIEGVELKHHGPTTAIDLSGWVSSSDSPCGLHKGRRSDLSYARRQLTASISDCSEPKRCSAFLEFRRIYNETMHRLSASAFYLFPDQYYSTLAEGLRENMCVVIARSQDTAVGGAIFFADKKFAHYHLSGTTDLGRRTKATTLIITEGARWARSRGCELLHLGGGTGGDDSLFRFKRSFGGGELRYRFVTFIVDQQRYNTLVDLRENAERLSAPRRDFFPRYRA